MRRSPRRQGCRTGSSGSDTPTSSTQPGLDTLALELSQALLVRRLFPKAPIKYMPPTKHKQTDIFFSHAYDTLADATAAMTHQGIQLLGMMTEALHTPLLMDRYEALKTADYVLSGRAPLRRGFRLLKRERAHRAPRASRCLREAEVLLKRGPPENGLFATIGKARFGDVSRLPDGGKGLDGVFERGPSYFNPLPRDPRGVAQAVLAAKTAFPPQRAKHVPAGSERVVRRLPIRPSLAGSPSRRRDPRRRPIQPEKDEPDVAGVQAQRAF